MGSATVDPDRFFDWLETTYPYAPIASFTRSYIPRAVLVAGLVGMNQTIPLIQWMQETAFPTDKSGGVYVPGQSELYTEWGNPAGMGATNPGGTKGNPNASKFIGKPEQAAEAQVAHLLLYALGPEAAIDRWRMAGLGDLTKVDPRYGAYVAKYGTKSRAPLLSDLAGQWAEDEAYAVGMAGWANRSGIEKMGAGSMSTKVTKKTLVVITDAGHRSTDRSGNPAEMALTGFMASAVVSELRRRGVEAYWYQRDLDADADSDETIGTLDTVGRGIASKITSFVRAGKFVVLLSEHYDGANSPIHVIAPDTKGLGTRIAGGAPSWDNFANNALDRELASMIFETYQKAGLGGVYTPPSGSGYPRGVMPEWRTGVAIDNKARLAIFAYPAAQGQDIMSETIRLVVENGGTNDTAARRADFTERAARAQADALFAMFDLDEIDNDGYAKRTKIDGPVQDRWIGGRLYLDNADNRRTLAAKATPYAVPDTSTKPSGSDFPAGRSVTVDYITVGLDGKTPALFFVGKSGSHLLASKFFKR